MNQLMSGKEKVNCVRMHSKFRVGKRVKEQALVLNAYPYTSSPRVVTFGTLPPWQMA
jgi:hypothetical protein